MMGGFFDILSKLHDEGLARPRGYIGPPRQGPSRDRALPGKKRIRARKAANRSSRILQGEHRPHVVASEATHGVPKVALWNYSALEEMKVPRLREVAKELGLSGYSALRRHELIEYIYQSDENRR